MRVLEIKSARIWLGDEGILRVVVYPGTLLTKANIEEHMSTAMTLTGGARLPVLVDTRGVKSVPREARAHLTSEQAAKHILAQALLIDSPLTRLIASFMIGLNRTPFATQIFTSEEKALVWLRAFLPAPRP